VRDFRSLGSYTISLNLKNRLSIILADNYAETPYNNMAAIMLKKLILFTLCFHFLALGLTVGTEKYPNDIPNSMKLNVVYIPQNDTKSCATTSIAMVISYYENLDHNPLDKETVWNISGIDEQAICTNGNDMEGLQRIADHYGYKSKFVEGMEIADIERLLSEGIPIMLNIKWKKASPQTHAILAIGYDKKKKILYINDPATRENNTLEYADLEARWSAHLNSPYGMSYRSGFIVYSKNSNHRFVADKIRDAEAGFQQRWRNFNGDAKNFPLWTPNWQEDDLRTRFDKMMKDRWSVYFVNPEDFGKPKAFGRWNEAYKMPENWESWGSRYPFPIAPLYNLASPDYNATIVTLHGMHFLAMEAPCDSNLKAFLQILNDYQITDLVRLTPKTDKERENCFPYWEGHLDIHSVSGGPSLEITGREIHYFPTDCWKNHQGIKPEKLLALIKTVKNSTISDRKRIAVHCRAGVGRSGVFISAYTLMDDIDRQIAQGIHIDDLNINIDRVIWELSLQRPFAVTHFPQYLTLYQFVNCYINHLKELG